MYKYELDLKDKTFGRWLVLKDYGFVEDHNNRRVRYWKCICSCKLKTVRKVSCYSLMSGDSISCGCINIETNTIHGQWNHPIKKVHEGMLRRCYNEEDDNYHNYGGRGIKVCSRWRHPTEGVLNFIEDMYPKYSKGLHIDRINNSKGYYPWNCRWVTPKVNTNNRRVTRFITIKGVKYPVTEAAAKFGIGPKTILYRLKLGWSDEDCITPAYQKRTELDIKLKRNKKKGRPQK